MIESLLVTLETLSTFTDNQRRVLLLTLLSFAVMC